MDLEDSFTQKLLERTQARREQIDKKLGLTPVVMAAVSPQTTKRRRTPLTEENASFEDSYEEFETYAARDSDSPKRQCLESSLSASSFCETPLGTPAESPVQSPLPDNKENSPVPVSLPALGVRGLAAIKRKKSGSYASPTISDSSNHLEHEVWHDEKTFTTHTKTNPRSRLANLAAAIGEWEDQSLPAQRKRLTKPSEPSAICATNTTTIPANLSVPLPNPPKSSQIFPAPTKETPVGGGGGKKPFEASKVQQVRKAQIWDKAVLTVLESQGFIKSPSASKLSYKYSEQEQETSTLVRNRMRMFEKSDSQGQQQQQVHSKNPVVAFKKPAVTPSKITNHSEDTASNHPTLCPRLPNFSITHSSVAPPPSENKDPAQLSLAARRALFEAPLLIIQEDEEESPENLTVSQRTALFEKAMNTPTKKLAGRSNMRGPSPAKKEEIQAILPSHPSSVPTAGQNVLPLPPPISPGILRKTCNPQINGKADGVLSKTVRFSPSPAKIQLTESTASDKPHKLQPPQASPTPRSPIKAPTIVGTHTQEMHQKLLGQRSTSTGKLVDKTIAERKLEMEQLLFGRRNAQQDTEDPDITQEEDAADQEDNNQELQSQQQQWIRDNSSSEQVSEENSYQDENSSETELMNVPPPSSHMSTSKNDGMISRPSFIREGVAVCEQINQMLDEAIDSESDLEPEPIMARSPIAPSPQKVYINPINGKLEEEGTSLVHSVSVYRRQKQALCTPPIRVIQRKPLLESPPSPQKPDEDPQRILEIQEKIQHLQESLHCQEVQVRQACQALHLCAAKPEFFGSTEHIEGERLLLIASHKRNAYRSTLERLKTEGALGAPLRHVMATLTLSEIRLPLKHEFLSAHIARTNGDAVHYFFCLIRYREKVIATEMLCTRNGITAGTLSFSNHICIQELQNNFNVLFEVYALQTNGESVPHDRKYSIKKEQGKLKGKKFESKAKLSPATSSPAGQNLRERSSNFGLVGLVQLTVDNCSRKILPMEKVPQCSPLDGRAYAKIQLCTQQPVKEQGFLTMFEDVSGFGAWHRRFVVLAGNYLSFWKYPDQVQTEVPMGSIDLRTCTTPEVCLVSADVCARKNTFMLLCVRPQSHSDQDTLTSQLHATHHTSTKHLISADTKGERLLWCAQINRALQIIRKWDPKALGPRDINH